MIGYNVYPNSYSLPNWKGVILAGIIASLFNSFTGAYLKGELIEPGYLMSIIIRYIVGDISGLIISMIMLVLSCVYWINLQNRHNKKWSYGFSAVILVG